MSGRKRYTATQKVKLGFGITVFILVSLLGLLFYGLRNEKKETQLATN
ncbi:hypothetical protein IIA29_07490 [candidate division KSB1 bacterium]|nr:hypothetical protein [candidate division KSB1 bacterium]